MTTSADTTNTENDAVVIPATHARVVVDEISPEAAASLRRHVEEASGGGNRFAWFLMGFAAALVAGVVAAVAFLAVSDSDDDGNVQFDVPVVDVDVEP